MSTLTKITAYVAVLLVAFAGAFGLGRGLGDTSEDRPEPGPSPTEVHGSRPHTEEGAP